MNVAMGLGRSSQPNVSIGRGRHEIREQTGRRTRAHSVVTKVRVSVFIAIAEEKTHRMVGQVARKKNRDLIFIANIDPEIHR